MNAPSRTLLALALIFLWPSFGHAKYPTLCFGSDPFIEARLQRKSWDLATAQGMGLMFLPLLYDRLVEIDSTDKIRPGLAMSWKNDVRFATYTLALRPGIPFHEKRGFKLNRNFNADDVIYSLESFAEAKSRLLSVKRTNELTVTLELRQPDPHFMKWLARAMVPIQPKEYVDYRYYEPMKNPADNIPLGTGPYEVEAYIPQVLVKLRLNPRQFRANSSGPEGMFISFSPHQEIRFEKLDKGECTLAVGDGPGFEVRGGVEVQSILSKLFIYDFSKLSRSYGH